MFTTPSNLLQAEAKVRNFNLCHLKDDKRAPQDRKEVYVWLDWVKIKAQLRPARVIHRKGGYLAGLEHAKEGDFRAQKVMNVNYINLGTHCAYHTLRSDLK